MADHRKIVTVHAPLPLKLVDDVLTSVEAALDDVGADRVWIDPQYRPDLVVMAELPDRE